MRFWSLSHLHKNPFNHTSSRASGQYFNLNLHLHPYLLYASSEGFGESVPESPKPSLLVNVMSIVIISNVLAGSFL